jgi:hypothetical protein
VNRLLPSSRSLDWGPRRYCLDLPGWSGLTVAACLLFALLLVGAPTTGHADPPINDSCADAIELSDGSFEFTTIEAVTDGPDASACVTFGSQQTWNDIWYRYTAPIDGVLVISTCGTVDYDSRIVLYTGDCGDLVEHACNDDGSGCAGYSSYLLTHCTKGVEYLVRVGGYSESSFGTGTFGVKSVEPCVTSCIEGSQQELETCSEDFNGGCATGNGQSETESLSSGVPICGTWYVEGQTRDTDYYIIDVPEPGGFIMADLYSNDRVIGYVFLAENSCPTNVLMYSYGGCPTPLDSNWLEPGSYRIIIAPSFESEIDCNDSHGTNQYVLSVEVSDGGITAPDNDLCDSPEVISNGVWPFSTLLSNTDGPTKSPEECGAFSSNIGSDIWFRYASSCEGDVTVSLCDGVNFDTRLEIWEGGCDGVLLACNDDDPECQNYSSLVTFPGRCGVDYLIRLGGYDGAAGTGEMSVICVGTCDCNGNQIADQDEIDQGLVADCDLNGIPDECALAGSDPGTDCNQNGLLDVCEIASGSEIDSDEDGILDVCQCEIHPAACCIADLDGDGIVGGSDLSMVLGGWGTSDPQADLDGNGMVQGADLAIVLGAWGDC